MYGLKLPYRARYGLMCWGIFKFAFSMASSIYCHPMMTWQQQLQTAITSSAQLYEYVHVDLPVADDAGFAVRVPTAFADRMQKGNPRDPLLLQVVARAPEVQAIFGFTQDPLSEYDASPIPGLLHKYTGRVLVVLTGSCAVNCRYCFRRHFAYSENGALKQWPAILDYIRRDESISEVILSGGDPLLVDDAKLASLIADIETIAHVHTLRVHTRFPVMIPERITEQLLHLFEQTRLHVVIVLHINHAQEIDAGLSARIKQLKRVAQVLNQSVLLKDINDSVSALENLSQRLWSIGVLPYYLHQLDAVAGAHHFHVSLDEGRRLITQLQTRLPGYLVPKYVQEVSGEPNKVSITLRP